MDPTTGTHTQNIEYTWMRAKNDTEKAVRMHRSLFDSYLQEFMWRQIYNEKPFKSLVRQIAETYPIV